MAVTTTLMTFLVRAPPATRTVSLYGSWDNFTKSYAMRRDTRLGVEHWSGCHNFDNIICDGRVSDSKQPRKGALRMGGTYWYYYKLNDEIEFHNSAEPSTTSCPLLPGQLVNVLQVPVVLSGARERNTSVSSTSSDLRTLNPGDKYLNPRPVPAPPKTLRLTTSPTLTQYASSAASSPVTSIQSNLSRSSSRDNLKNSDHLRLAHKGSLDTLTRPNQITRKPVGLRQAFRTLRNGRSPSPSTRPKLILEWPPSIAKSIKSAPQTPETVSEASSYFDYAKAEQVVPKRDLLLRSSSETSIPTTSFLEHRRERSRSRSRSRETSSIHTPGGLDDDDCSAQEISHASRLPLDTVVEVVSPQPTPLNTAIASHRSLTKSTLDSDGTNSTLRLEKRLPTLPNTPSSAYPPSMIDDSPQRKLADKLRDLQSHFSCTTIDTSSPVSTLLLPDNSRFSEWSATSDLISPMSDSTIDESISSPVNTEPRNSGVIMNSSSTDDRGSINPISQDDTWVGGIVSSTSCTTISSAVSSVPPTSHENVPVFNMHGTNICRQMEFVGENFIHYRLPEAQHGSEITLKPSQMDSRPPSKPSDDLSHVHIRAQTSRLQTRRDGFPHSESMQQLIDELSYLSDVIIHS